MAARAGQAEDLICNACLRGGLQNRARSFVYKLG